MHIKAKLISLGEIIVSSSKLLSTGTTRNEEILASRVTKDDPLPRLEKLSCTKTWTSFFVHNKM